MDIAQKMLGRLGYRVRFCGSLAEFTARPGGFAVVISDLTMPGMNGLQLLGRARTLKASLLMAKPLGYRGLGQRSRRC